MILRNCKWIITLHLLYLLIVTEAQNERSYDTNDWIPITPSAQEKSVLIEQKKATGRVLNLDAPQQKFFPDEEYRKKRPAVVDQYLRETHFTKSRPHTRQHKQKYERPYKFESVPRYHPKPQPPLQYFTNQEVKPPTVEQPPPLAQPQLIQQPPPYQAPQFIYQQQPQISNVPQPLPQQQFAQSYPQQQIPQYPVDTSFQQYQQYAPFNTSLYQTINPSSINQELLGAIQNNQPLQPVTPKVESTTKAKEQDKETVQLVYVPLESLKSSQPISQDSQTVYNTVEVPRQEKQITSFTSYTPTSQRLAAIEKDFIQQALAAQKLQDDIRNGRPLTYEATSVRPKRRKPHQPPLAVYMGSEHHAEISEVLDVLKDAKTIAVQDNFRPNSPKVFIGPSTLTPPDGYSKFPLPYLNSIEGNRIERKIEQLPFFVAPLSYKTPDGYSKIPLPSPHVGSVVISHKDDLHDKHAAQQQTTFNNANQYQYVEKPQYLIKNFNHQEYNPQQLTLSQNPKINTAQYPKTVQEIKQAYQPPARPQLSQLPSTLLEPSKSPLTLNQDEVFTNTAQQPQVGPQNFQFEQISTKLPISKPQEYVIPVRTNPPQIVNNYNDYQIPIQTTLGPQYADFSQFTIPTAQTVKATTPETEPQSFNLSDKIKTSVEIASSLDVTPKTTLKDQLRKEIVPSYDAFTNPPPKSQQSFNVNPLELAINQFELEQINTQLQEKKQNKQVVPPASSSLYYDNSNIENTRFVSSTPSYENYEAVTTQRTEKPKRRGKPTRQQIRTTPPTTYDNTKYTILEDYTSRPRVSTPRPIETEQYETTPTVVYRQKPVTTEKYIKTEIENIPSNVYQLNPQTQPVYTENRPPVNQHILNGELLDQHILKSYISNDQKSTLEQTTTVYEELPSVEPLNSAKNENVEQGQVLSGYISNLQDQSVRALLVPNLLVPTTEQQKELTTTPRYVTTTERQIVITRPTEAPVIETTTTRRSRGRVRGNSVGRYSTTSTPRRTVNRRRPSYTRTTTERATTTSDYDKGTDYARRTVSNTKPRFRTRGRTNANSITERISHTSTTENDVKVFRQPELQSGFQASPLHNDPQSYMQFEHTIDNQKIITIKPEDVSEESQSKDYHQVYSLPPQNSKSNADDGGQNPVVDIKITHPLDSEIITKSNKDNQYVRFTSNIQSNRNSEESTTTRTNHRIRGRTRGKPRYPTTARTTTSTEAVRDKENQETEYYGFIRTPEYSKHQTIQTEATTAPTRYSSSYISSPQSKTVYNEEFVANGYSTESSELTSPIYFVGEIRPKYQSAQYQEESKLSIATAEQEVVTDEPVTSRTKSRIRHPSRTSNNINEINATTKRSRSRSRGNTHYRHTSKVQTTTDDADVAGGNYPASYLASKERTTEAPSFQITIDPNQEEQDDDQSPHSSIYSPKFVQKPSETWIEASALPFLNELPTEDKKENTVTPTTTEEPVALPVVRSTQPSTDESLQSIFNETSQEMSELLTKINDMAQVEEQTLTTTEPIDDITTTTKKSRRRGVWKLVRHQPLDHFETAESQNYDSVINNFDEIKKVDYRKKYFEPEWRQKVNSNEEETQQNSITTLEPENDSEDSAVTTTPETTTTTESSIFDALYDMFGMKSDDDDVTTTTTIETPTEPIQITTTTVSPTFPQEITEEPAATTLQSTHLVTNSTEKEPVITTNVPEDQEKEEPTTDNTRNTYEVEPWEMKAVKTSTSTEVSHETEICYKGRCVKSIDRKIKS